MLFLGSTDLIVYTPGCSGCGQSGSYQAYDPGSSQTSQSVSCMTDDYTCTTTDCDFADSCTWEDELSVFLLLRVCVDSCSCLLVLTFWNWIKPSHSYGDGSSIQGDLYKDVFTVGGLTSSSEVSLGGITDADVGSGGFEPTGVDGIWGFGRKTSLCSFATFYLVLSCVLCLYLVLSMLAFQDLSGWGGSSVFDHLVGDFNWYDGFSLCLLGNGGILSLGVNYTSDSRFQWTPIAQDQWYEVTVNDIKFGDVSLGISSWDINWNGVIVDSGTTLFIVSSQIFTAMRKVLEASCAKVCPSYSLQHQVLWKCQENSSLKLILSLSLSLYSRTIWWESAMWNKGNLSLMASATTWLPAKWPSSHLWALTSLTLETFPLKAPIISGKAQASPINTAWEFKPKMTCLSSLETSSFRGTTLSLTRILIWSALARSPVALQPRPVLLCCFCAQQNKSCFRNMWGLFRERNSFAIKKQESVFNWFSHFERVNISSSRKCKVLNPRMLEWKFKTKEQQ